MKMRKQLRKMTFHFHLDILVLFDLVCIEVQIVACHIAFVIQYCLKEILNYSYIPTK